MKLEDHPDNANLPPLNRPGTIIAFVVCFLAVSFMAMTLRLWARFKKKLVGWDDFFIVLSIAFVTAASAMVCESKCRKNPCYPS